MMTVRMRGWGLLVCVHVGALALAACSNGRGSLDNQDDGGGQQQAGPKVTIGGSVAGLAGSGLVLQNNGADDLVVSANGSFNFKTSVDTGSPYNITVRTQPASPSQGCAVVNAAGTATANVTNVTVTCSTGTFSVGGSVSGLAGSGLVLRNNGGDDLSIASNGSFTFATELPSGSAFEVAVVTQPTRPSQTCTVADASGTIGSGDVRTVRISCATNSFAIRGTVSGLRGSGLVLRNNGGDDVGVQSDGGFAFPTRIPSGSAFKVTVATQPSAPAQACSLQNDSGTVGDRDVDNIVITCALLQYTLGGTVTGLRRAGLKLVNGTDEVAPTADGPFTFPTSLLAGTSYNATIAASPLLQFCSLNNGAGVMPESNVSNITVHCSSFIGVGGTVSGLEGPGLELQTNGEKLAIAANGKFVVPTALPDGSPYQITVASQPANQVCTVTNGRGTIEKADATGVTVTCRRSTQ